MNSKATLCTALLVCTIASSSADITLSPGMLISDALQQARSAPKPLRIHVEEGDYVLTEPLVLGTSDSHVTWEGNGATFSGGRAITGWTEAERGVWKAVLPSDDWKFEQLWIDGRRATLARSPNKGYFHIAEAVGANVFPGLDKDMNFEAFSLVPAEYEMLKAIPAEQRSDMLVTVTHAWAVGQCRLAALDDATRAVRIAGRARYPFVEFEPDQRYWIQNFQAALDAPGEWYLDRAKGEVFYIPLEGEDMTKAEVVAPVSERLLVVKGAQNITFKGIRFKHAQYLYPKDGLHDGQAASSVEGCIEIENSQRIRFEECEIAHTGTHGIFFKNGCSNSSVRHCHLHDLGGGGVRIAETARPAEDRLCHNIEVDDCIIQHGGRMHPSACGVLITHARNCTISHCDIGDFFYTGVSIGWNWGYGESWGRDNRLENCHIHHLGWAYLSDMGGFYGLGNAPGTLIRGNHVHHVSSHRYGGWGLYNDEGSGDVLMENNLVHDTSESGFHQHYGYANRVRNNIFAFGKKAQIQRSRNEGRLCFTFEKNIVVWDPASPLLDGAEWNWKLYDKRERGDPRDSVIFRNNLYWPTDGKVPSLLTKTHFSWQQWRQLGRDAGSLFADPKFKELGRRDFQLLPDSPANKIGFKPWDFSLAGVRKGDEKWRALAAQGHVYPTWEQDAKPWPAPAYQIDQSFETAALGTLGIRNAKYQSQGKGDQVGVTDEISSPLSIDPSSKRCLKVQDVPGLEHSYEPVLDIFPTNWDSGTFSASFDVMAKPGANWFFEMREKNGDFAAGPYLRWFDGQIAASPDGKKRLTSIPAGEWFRVNLTAATGSGKWQVEITRQNGVKEAFTDLPCKQEWKSASYLLFSALATTRTAFYIDNLQLKPLLGKKH